jgi:hypothetical protein
VVTRYVGATVPKCKKSPGVTVRRMPDVALKRSGPSQEDVDKAAALLLAKEEEERTRKALLAEIVEKINRKHFVTVVNGQTRFCTIQD